MHCQIWTGSEPSPMGVPSYLLREGMRRTRTPGGRGVGKLTSHSPEMECGWELFSCLFLELVAKVFEL